MSSRECQGGRSAGRGGRCSAQVARSRRRSRLMPARPAAPVSSSSAVHRSHISTRFAKQSVLPLPHYETVVVDKLKVRAPAEGAGAWYSALSDLEADRVEMCPSQRLIDDDRHARYKEINILMKAVECQVIMCSLLELASAPFHFHQACACFHLLECPVII